MFILIIMRKIQIKMSEISSPTSKNGLVPKKGWKQLLLTGMGDVIKKKLIHCCLV